MAIDDNTSYELTGAQVKDLASKVNEKAKLTVLYTDAALDSATVLYSDSGYTTAVESQDVKAALDVGQVIVKDSDGVDYVLTSADITAGGQYQTVYDNNIYQINYEYDDDTIMSVQVKEVQSKLTAGSNITISSNTISATDTTYSAFTGATSSVAGTAGLVPAPATTDVDKYLKGDGTWATVQTGSSGLVLYANDSLHTPTSITDICTDSGLTTSADPTDMIAAIDAGSPVVIKYSTDEAVAVTSYDDHTGMVPDTISFTGQFLSNWKTNSPEFIKFTYSNTLTTWSAEGIDLPTDFTGATSSVAGTGGLVPAPAAGDQDKLLKGDGTWGNIDDRLYSMLIPDGTEIPANKDLNTLEFLKVGKYFCQPNTTVATLTNCPTTSAFMMEVFSPLSTTVDDETTDTWVYRLRKLTTFTGEVYYQQANSGGTIGTFTYQAWKKYLYNSVGTSQIDNSAVTEAKIAAAFKNKLFYNSGDVIQMADVSGNPGLALTGGLTTGNKDFYVSIPVAKLLTNISSATINSMTGYARGHGAYLTNMQGGNAVAQATTTTAKVNKLTNTIDIIFNRSGGWGATNNIAVSFQVTAFKITLS